MTEMYCLGLVKVFTLRNRAYRSKSFKELHALCLGRQLDASTFKHWRSRFWAKHSVNRSPITHPSSVAIMNSFIDFKKKNHAPMENVRPALEEIHHKWPQTSGTQSGWNFDCAKRDKMMPDQTLCLKGPIWIRENSTFSSTTCAVFKTLRRLLKFLVNKDSPNGSRCSPKYWFA